MPIGAQELISESAAVESKIYGKSEIVNSTSRLRNDSEFPLNQKIIVGGGRTGGEVAEVASGGADDQTMLPNNFRDREYNIDRIAREAVGEIIASRIAVWSRKIADAYIDDFKLSLMHVKGFYSDAEEPRCLKTDNIENIISDFRSWNIEYGDLIIELMKIGDFGESFMEWCRTVTDMTNNLSIRVTTFHDGLLANHAAMVMNKALHTYRMHKLHGAALSDEDEAAIAAINEFANESLEYIETTGSETMEYEIEFRFAEAGLKRVLRARRESQGDVSDQFKNEIRNVHRNLKSASLCASEFRAKTALKRIEIDLAPQGSLGNVVEVTQRLFDQIPNCSQRAKDFMQSTVGEMGRYVEVITLRRTWFPTFVSTL
jgi:hypothetical protein